jgi:hypothetical protein
MEFENILDDIKNNEKVEKTVKSPPSFLLELPTYNRSPNY